MTIQNRSVTNKADATAAIILLELSKTVQLKTDETPLADVAAMDALAY